ncbi:MAG: hypothetical protein ACW98X_01970 [Promethearchaeota archaeon]|jgi:hypothetical protein
MLKCHLCGKEYHHDGKVCHTCEETANNSLLHQGGNQPKKWRCDNFLELKSLPFGCNLDMGINLGPKMVECPECGEEYSYGRLISHTCRTNSVSFGTIFNLETEQRKWNCDTELACIELPKLNLDSVEHIAEKIPSREKLENKEHDWNLLTSIRFNKTELNEEKINHFLKFE